jgi:hypothetical protein
VLYNFGREDELDCEAVTRLVSSLSRLLEPGAALQATTPAGWEFVSSVPMGGAYVLDRLWQKLGIAAAARGRVTGRRLDPGALERVLFGLVANRALAQLIVGMAVTRDGIPVRCWCWPGNTGDQALIRQARDDMREWTLARIIWVGDRGFSSAQNRRHLMRAGGAYILARSSAPHPRTSRPPCCGRAVTGRSPRTCTSRRCGSATTPTGWSSASTPRPPPATPPSGSRCSRSWRT